jgi:hypothetical protein
MKNWKIIPGICLAVILTISLTPMAWTALITSDSQAVLLQYNTGSDTSGIAAFSNLRRIKPDGTLETFVLPANKAIVVTWLKFNIAAVNTSLVTQADLRMGPFYSRALKMINGNVGIWESIDPGVLISPPGFTSPINSNFYSVNLQTGDIIPGTLDVRLVGFLVPYP